MAVKSCTMLAVQADGASVTTIEGMATGDALHPLQTAFWEKHGLQCGFCTPGMIMVAADLLAPQQRPTTRRASGTRSKGNICRCTGYHNIVAAVQGRRGGDARWRRRSGSCRRQRVGRGAEP